MKTCYIFGALNVESFNYSPDETDLIIAADRGLETLNKFNITPHYIVGDFDSLGYTPQGNNVIKHPAMKNETDTILAIDIAMEKGFKSFIILGCIGGRADHTYANIQACYYVAQKGGNAVLVDNNSYITVIKDNVITFDNSCYGNISVFSYTDESTVTLDGLLYTLENKILTSGFPLGVSNEFTGKKATVSVKNGAVCVMWQTHTGSYKIGG